MDTWSQAPARTGAVLVAIDGSEASLRSPHLGSR